VSSATTIEAAAKKKSHRPSEQQRLAVKQQRAAFRARAAHWIVSRLKFLAETGTKLNMTRLYGRALPGERVVEDMPSDYGSNYTLIGVIGLKGLQAPWLLEGALNGELFKRYISEVLAPILQPGDILVMDNLSTHKVAGIDELVAARGARLKYLSPYSPDYNPIERCWSKIKTSLRRAKARTYEALVDAIKEALATISESDIRAWFKFCGYSIH
jgi:transposase